MGADATLLINPPLWNAYAPHLAVPLLAGVLRSRGLPVHSHDASIAVLDWVLSRDGQEALAAKGWDTRDERLAARAGLVHEHAIRNVDRAKQVIRSADALFDRAGQAWARTVMRNAMWCASAAFADFSFDLVANQLYFSATSTAGVMAAVDDAERNIYRWAIDRMLPEDLLSGDDLAVVGLSVSADTQLIAAMTIAHRIRALRPDVTVVMGGNFTTRMVDRWDRPHTFFELVDAFVLSEGEDVLPEIVTRVATGRALDGIPGVVTLRDGALAGTEARPVKLDDVAPADFSDLPLDRYFAPGPIFPLYASRSCAWSCAFCSIPFASNNFRRRPAAATVDQMQHIMERHGARHFMFIDEILTLNVLRDVADEIVHRGLDLYWYGETRFARGFDQGLADLLYRSGCRRLNFGLESYNQRVLDLMRKGTKIEHIDSTVDVMLRAGIAPHLFVIHGFPGETREEAQRTVEYARTIVARSEQEFGNPYTTWGGAPFVLDVHSPVCKAPHEFGIVVVDPPAGEDLSLARDYVTSAGMSRAEAERLAADARDSRAIRRNVWFRDQGQATLAEVEEYTFHRACSGAPNAEPHRVRPGRFATVAGSTTVGIAGSCRELPWDADPTANDAAVALYNGDRDTFVQLNWPKDVPVSALRTSSLDQLAGLFTERGVAWGTTSGAALVGLLIRHGIVAVDDEDLVPHDAAPRYTQEGAVLTTEDDRGRLILHSPATGNTVRLDALGQLVWVLGETGVSRDEVAGELAATVPAAEMVARAMDAVTELTELGFLYETAVAAEPPGGGRWLVTVPGASVSDGRYGTARLQALA